MAKIKGVKKVLWNELLIAAIGLRGKIHVGAILSVFGGEFGS